MQGQTAEVSTQNQNNKYNKIKESEIVCDSNNRENKNTILENTEKIPKTKSEEEKKRGSEEKYVGNRKNKNIDTERPQGPYVSHLLVVGLVK